MTHSSSPAGQAHRPYPAQNKDNAFFFKALDEGRVVAQKCTECGTLRHPPNPMCATCLSLDWQEHELGPDATLYSFVVVHHPVIPPFSPGYVVALVEYPEGIRMIMNLEGIPSDSAEIGMPLKVSPERVDDQLVLMVARPTTTHENGGPTSTAERNSQ